MVVLCVGRIEEVARIERGSLLSSGGGDLLISGVVDTTAGPLQLVDVEHAVRRVTSQVRELTARLH
jgi:hypothetical protein